MPAAATSVMSANARLPTLPKDWMKRLASGSRPSPGKSRASAGARKIGNPRDASVRVSMRSTLPCVICGSGRFDIMRATIVAGTASASKAAMALAELDQVSERMPPAMMVAVTQATTSDRHQALGLAGQPGRGIGGKARLGREQQQKGHGEDGGRDDPAASGSRSGGRDSVGIV